MIPKLLISSELEERKSEIEEVLLEFGIKNPHPDLLYLPFEAKLGIEQSKAIKDHLTYKPIQAKGKVVVIEDASNLTIEAQNALLKTLEESPKESLIILGVRTEADLLSTILSRCQIIHLQPLPAWNVSSRFQEDIKKLLNSGIPERFAYIEKLTDREAFLKDLTLFFHKDLASQSGIENLKFIKELLQAEEWAAQNVNIRGILEYLMLVMPFQK